MKSIQGSSKRIETFSKIVHLVIALILGGFLSALGNKILNDMDEWFIEPNYENYKSTDSANKIKKEIYFLENKEKSINEKIEELKVGYNISARNYSSEKESYENWIKSRNTIGNPAQDPEIITRLKRLDELNNTKSSWQQAIDSFQTSYKNTTASKRELNEKLEELDNKASFKYDTDLESYNLKIFFVRLVFSIPILILGIYLFIKYRDGKYRAFFWGIIFFSLYIFFIGLVPYLPSYGGYVRYAVGIIVTIVVGYYLIRQITSYYERKNSELQKSVEERISKIKYETAIKSYQLHTCPSCENDYYLIRDTDNKPNFCIHCGLLLFENCTSCNSRNFAHFTFCSSCGSGLKNNNSEVKNELTM